MLTIIGNPLLACDFLLNVKPRFFHSRLVQGRNIGIVSGKTQNHLSRRGKRSLPSLPPFRGLCPARSAMTRVSRRSLELDNHDAGILLGIPHLFFSNVADKWLATLASASMPPCAGPEQRFMILPTKPGGCLINVAPAVAPKAGSAR
jgi:hypothetical protein